MIATPHSRRSFVFRQSFAIASTTSHWVGNILLLCSKYDANNAQQPLDAKVLFYTSGARYPDGDAAHLLRLLGFCRRTYTEARMLPFALS